MEWQAGCYHHLPRTYLRNFTWTVADQLVRVIRRVSVTLIGQSFIALPPCSRARPVPEPVWPILTGAPAGAARTAFAHERKHVNTTIARVNSVSVTLLSVWSPAFGLMPGLRRRSVRLRLAGACKRRLRPVRCDARRVFSLFARCDKAASFWRGLMFLP